MSKNISTNLDKTYCFERVYSLLIITCFKCGMLVSITTAAKQIGVCAKTLRRWERAGKLYPLRTLGNHRRYETEALTQFLQTGAYICPKKIITKSAAVYARVSAGKQKTDLTTQTAYLVAIAEREGFQPKVYTDIASGLNDQRKGLIRHYP